MLTFRPALKPVIWMGTAFNDLRAFPVEVRKDAGYQLHKIQSGLDATDWKSMAEIGPGVAEIRLRDRTSAYRIFYIARFEEAIYILHCFNKRSQRTALADKTLARLRYRDVIEHHRSQHEKR